MQINVKKVRDNAVIPQYAKPGDAGLDLTAAELEVTPEGIVIGYTGLALEIPEGYVGLLFPRSSISKYDLSLTNCVGVIDSGYRGEVIVKFRNTRTDEKYAKIYSKGDRVAQLIVMPYPKITLVEAQELSQTERGEGGFGSTGISA